MALHVSRLRQEVVQVSPNQRGLQRDWVGQDVGWALRHTLTHIVGVVSCAVWRV